MLSRVTRASDTDISDSPKRASMMSRLKNIASRIAGPFGLSESISSITARFIHSIFSLALSRASISFGSRIWLVLYSEMRCLGDGNAGSE